MRNLALASLAAMAMSACASLPVEAQSPSAPQGLPDDSAQAQLKAYPEATAGQKRNVIYLPATENEDHLKVEIIVGQQQTIDCNHHVLGGEVQTRTAEGWGYDYYVVPAITPGISTLMGCPANSQREAFVVLGQQTIVRYNSRLPVVVYTPENVEVRYRLWTAGEIRGLD